ncbi:MAG: hypothetical protein MUO76_04475, partial [Anaerolineaceae bacterium]|nr:hypothetical protein [Anaerolineaceae bacterium]
VGLTDILNPLTKDDISVFPEKVDNYFTTVTIEVTYAYKPVTPGIKALFGLTEGIDLTAQSTMHVTPGAR